MSTTTDPTRIPTTTAPDRPRPVLRAVIGSAVLALAANLLLWGTARLLGVDFTVSPPNGAAMTVGPAVISAMTLAPLMVGGLVLAVASRRRAGAWRLVGWLGLIVGIVTAPMPFTVEAVFGTQLSRQPCTSSPGWSGG